VRRSFSLRRNPFRAAAAARVAGVMAETAEPAEKAATGAGAVTVKSPAAGAATKIRAVTA